jgi:GNAT superfamily N-acetyltransferase
MSRGVGMVLLNHIMHQAREAGVELRADFVETGRNRMMQVTYAFAGFQEIDRNGDHIVLRADLAGLQDPPAYVAIEVLSDGEVPE